MKKEFIFLGPPGSGKGTQTARLSKDLGLPHIDTGSLLRAEIASETPNGILAKSFIDKGQLVPLEVVTSIIKNRLSQEDCKNGFILDGYPRSIEQAEALEKIKNEIDGSEEIKYTAVYFETDMNALVERIVNRRMCSKCGEIFNIKTKAPKEEGLCDKCSSELIRRKDDNEETCKLRFETYEKQTAPLVEYYEKKGILKRLVAHGSIDETYTDLRKITG